MQASAGAGSRFANRIKGSAGGMPWRRPGPRGAILDAGGQWARVGGVVTSSPAGPWMGPAWPDLLTSGRFRALKNKWESADKPGSVEGNHPSGTRVAARLERPTRKPPRAAGADPATRTLPYLALLQVGFAVPPNVATGAVRSYRTVSPLPADLRRHRRFAFCCTVRGLAPPRRYLAPCSVEPGLSSAKFRSGCLADSHAQYSARSVCPALNPSTQARAPGRRVPCVAGR
jgi:hypothetical protein